MMKDQGTLFKAGSYIYIEGDEDVENVYIVGKGLVEFKSSTKRVRSHGDTAEAGDVFGAVSSLSRRPRMETAFAKINTSVFIFSREKFLSVLQKNSDIAIKLLNTFADELRLYDTMIFPLGTSHQVLLAEDVQMFNLGKFYYEMKGFSTAGYILNRYVDLYPQGQHMQEARSMVEDVQAKGARWASQPAPEGIYKRYGDRQVIFCEHEPGDEIFVIKKGKIKIVKHQDGSEMILSILGEGDIFGELAIISDKPRNATAISFGSTVLLPIDKAALLKLIQKSSDILKRIFTAISQRVWFTFIRMESKFYEKPITRIYVFLENKLIEDNISLKSGDPHTFHFGIDELLRMTNTPERLTASIMEELTRDQNLEFTLGRTMIDSPGTVSSKARYYRTRDRLYEGVDRDKGNSLRERFQPSAPNHDNPGMGSGVRKSTTAFKNKTEDADSTCEEPENEPEQNG
jgi:CRP-like cAMP-binding protein